MKTACIVGVVALLVLGLALPAFGRVLYAVPLEDGSRLVSVIEQVGTVRHIGSGEALVEGSASLGEELGRSGIGARRVCDTRDADGLYLCYPRATVDELRSVGAILWEEPRGAVLVGASVALEDELRRLSFMVYPLPERVDAAVWFDDRPPAHIQARTRSDELALRASVQSVIDSVSTDRMMAHVESLSTYPNGDLRSRFVYRWEDCFRHTKPYIIDQLTASLPETAAIYSQRFHLDGYTCDGGPSGGTESYPADNIVGVLPGTGRLSGCYIVCGHYDATAASTDTFPHGAYDEPPYYWWCRHPAPGADDNATGVATVLEVARVLGQSGLEFPFDIRFVLFSGEELGLWGSKAYADSVAGYRSGVDSLVAPPDTIYGVLNVDMIAYKRSESNPDTCHLVTNPGSVWLADWVIATAESLYPESFEGFEACRIDSALAYSDHARFWSHGYDAFVAIEHWWPRERNPYYHTLGDVMETVSPSQLSATARMMAGAIARLADPESQINLAVFEDDLSFSAPLTGSDTYYTTDRLSYLQPARVRVDVHAFGPSQEVELDVEIWDGAPDEGELFASFSLAKTVGGGEVITREFDWELTEADVGEHLMSVRVTAEGTDELALWDNVADSIQVVVTAPSLYLLDHYPWPNPAPSVDALNFSYNLSRNSDGIAILRIYDLTGQMLAERIISHTTGSGPHGTPGLASGPNTIPWSSMNTSVGDLASGVYLYQLTISEYGRSEPVIQEMGKFAIVR